ncbi:MAG: tetratricopeptide repeat protein [Myxococcota bacterium]
MVQGLIPVAQAEIALLLESGYLYMEMQKYKEAEEIFAGVAALVPHSDTPLICLGNLALTQGQYDRALRHHKEALQRQPTSALAHAHSGEALIFLKKKDDARAALNRAVELDESGPAGAFAKSLLDALAAEVI